MSPTKKIKLSTYSQPNEFSAKLPCGFTFNFANIKTIDSKSFVNCKLCFQVHFVETFKSEKKHVNNCKEYFSKHFQDLERKVEIRREEIKACVDETSTKIIRQIKEKNKQFEKRNKTVNDRRELDILQLEASKFEFNSSGEFSQKHFGSLTQKQESLLRIDKINTCRFWNLETNECLKTIQLKDANKIWIHKVIQPHFLLTLCHDDLFRVFDLTSGDCLKSFTAFEDSNEHFSNNQLFVISNKYFAMDAKPKIFIYNIENECLEKEFDLKDESRIAVRILAFLENFNFLYGFYHAAKQMNMKLVEYATGSILQTYTGHSEAIKNVHILTNRQQFVSSSFNQIKIWNIDTGECFRSILNDEFHYSKCLILTQNGLLVNLSPEDSLSIWDTCDDFKWLGEFRYPNFKPTYTIKPLSGDRILSYYNDRRMLIWDLGLGKCLSVFDSREDGFNFKLEFY